MKYIINSFIVCAEEVYPPGEIYAVEKIITDSYIVGKTTAFSDKYSGRDGMHQQRNKNVHC